MYNSRYEERTPVYAVNLHFLKNHEQMIHLWRRLHKTTYSPCKLVLLNPNDESMEAYKHFIEERSISFDEHIYAAALDKYLGTNAAKVFLSAVFDWETAEKIF